MSKTLKIQLSCEIDDLIDVMSDAMGKPYSEVENMAFEEWIFPESKKTFVTTRFGKDDRCKPGTLRNAIFDYMVRNHIVDLHITYPI